MLVHYLSSSAGSIQVGELEWLNGQVSFTDIEFFFLFASSDLIQEFAEPNIFKENPPDPWISAMFSDILLRPENRSSLDQCQKTWFLPLLVQIVDLIISDLIVNFLLKYANF